jgi:hypothetical protein
MFHYSGNENITYIILYLRSTRLGIRLHVIALVLVQHVKSKEFHKAFTL